MKLVMFLFPVVSFLNIYIRSEGCDDPGKTFDTCGRAYIMVNGKDHSVHGRGHNVVTVDAATGVVGHVQFIGLKYSIIVNSLLLCVCLVIDQR